MSELFEFIQVGRSPAELICEFEPTAVTITSWVRQVDLDESCRSFGLTVEEHRDLRRKDLP